MGEIQVVKQRGRGVTKPFSDRPLQSVGSVQGLFAQGQHGIRLIRLLARFHCAGRKLHNVVVEGAAQPTVGGDGHNQHPLDLTNFRVLTFPLLQAGAHIGQHALKLHCIRAHLGDGVLRTTKLGCRHHLHCRGDLHGVLHRGDAFAYFLKSSSHGLTNQA